MAKDDIIKNKDRDISSQHLAGKYVPEHVRLGKKPLDKGLTSSSEEAKLPPGESFGFEMPPLKVDSSIIDNNEFVDLTLSNQQRQDSGQQIDNSEAKSDIKSNEYILMIYGKIIETGPISMIEELISSIVYGEHPSLKDISLDDMVVLKRVSIKFGVFLDE